MIPVSLKRDFAETTVLAAQTTLRRIGEQTNSFHPKFVVVFGHGGGMLPYVTRNAHHVSRFMPLRYNSK